MNIDFLIGILHLRLNWLCTAFKDIKNFQEEKERLTKQIDEHKEKIKDIFFDKQYDIKTFIDEKLQEAIDKYDLNHGRDDNQTIEEITYYSSSVNKDDSGGNSGKQVWTRPNPNSKFIPSQDEYEVTNVETNHMGQYKVTVENIKGRKHITPFMWEPDYFSTDWFEINS